ncbi:uncharacterized protein TNCV_4165601 [Trichonephila clavipes]|nr:uncharacterized protein TNCV_4165601 [Trichonephila clavipes]
MHKEEKCFVKERKKEKLAASPVKKVTRKKQEKTQKNIANLLSATAESPSEYLREYRAWKKKKKTLQNTLLMLSLRDENAIETFLMTVQINTDLVNHPVPINYRALNNSSACWN